MRFVRKRIPPRKGGSTFGSLLLATLAGITLTLGCGQGWAASFKAAAPVGSVAAVCGASFNSELRLTSCGADTSPLDSITSLTGGGESYNYSIADAGLDAGLVSILIPPAGFNPLAASSAQLAEYEFPPRPTDPEDLAAWVSDMTNVTPETPLPSSLQSLPEQFTPPHQLWSGWAVPTRHNVVTSVTVRYNEPTYQYRRCPYRPATGIWAGLGDYPIPQSKLGQDGTAFGYGSLGADEAWMQVLPYMNQPRDLHFYAKFGDGVVAYVKWEPKLKGTFRGQPVTGGYAGFVEDKARHKYRAWAYATGPYPYQGDSAEAIMERPPGFDNLPYFRSMQFTSTAFNNSKHFDAPGLNPRRIYLTNDGTPSGKPLDDVGRLGMNGAFTVTRTNYCGKTVAR